MSPNAAPATKSHTPTSANTAPATQNESLGIYSLLASIHSWHLFPLGIYSLLASILFWHLFSLGIYSLLYWKIQHFALRLSPKMSPSAAPATKSHTPTSPNTAPATQNASHDWSALECAEQAKSTSNLSKYCACHEICKFKTSAETPWIASANRKTIRG